MRFWCDLGTLLEIAVVLFVLGAYAGWIFLQSERTTPRSPYEKLCHTFAIEPISSPIHYELLVKRIQEMSNFPNGYDDAQHTYLTALWIMKHHYDRNQFKTHESLKTWA